MEIYTEVENLTVTIAHASRDFVLLGADSAVGTIFGHIVAINQKPTDQRAWRTDATKIKKVSPHTGVTMASDDADLALTLCQRIKERAHEKGLDDAKTIARLTSSELAQMYQISASSKPVMLTLAGLGPRGPELWELDSHKNFQPEIRHTFAINGQVWVAHLFYDFFSRDKLRELDLQSAMKLMALSLGQSGFHIKGLVSGPYKVATITERKGFQGPEVVDALAEDMNGKLYEFVRAQIERKLDATP